MFSVYGDKCITSYINKIGEISEVEYTIQFVDIEEERKLDENIDSEQSDEK